ncbi:MAG: nuclear transport factor 2 family protein [Steroidobacter sp.]
MIRTGLLVLLMSLAVISRANEADDEAAVIAALHAACEAYRVGDAGYLERVLDDRFTLTDPAGVITTKAEELAAVRKGDPKYEVFRNSAMKVRLHGDAALVTGTTTVKGVSGGETFNTALQFTDTLIRHEGEWRIAASHVSPLAVH